VPTFTTVGSVSLIEFTATWAFYWFCGYEFYPSSFSTHRTLGGILWKGVLVSVAIFVATVFSERFRRHRY
jgi:cell shape-determining protein MreD